MKLICIVRVCVMFLFVSDCSSTDIKQLVARSLPLKDVVLNRAPFYELVSNSKVKCLSECMRKNCASFNYGGGLCELLDTYLCDGIETLTIREGFQHYDVEAGDMIPVAGVYRNEIGCVTSGICSPKCYLPTTTTMAPATTTTMAPATTTTMPPATTTTMAPATTTTMPPATTTTMPPATTTTMPPATTTTMPPATTTTMPPATTTTMAPATTTTMPPATTTTMPPATTTTMAPATTTTMPSAPGPGEVNYSCSSDIDCTTVNSSCRNFAVCECVAGYSYDPAAKTCSTTCPGGYGNTFTLTTGVYVYGADSTNSYLDSDTCELDCIADPTCISFMYETDDEECIIIHVIAAGFWVEASYSDYYQRNCL